MNNYDALELAFRKSFDDKFLSKTERDSLRQLYLAANLDQSNHDVLRAKLFAMARSVSKDNDAQFAFEWLEAATRILDEKPLQAKTAGSHVFFSPGDFCLNAIVSQIQSAQKTLDICVFTISDDRISDALIATHQRKVRVRLVTDNEKLLDLGSDIERHVKAGIAVKVDRTEHHMHHKFAVVDGKSVVTGSYNWTKSAAEFNQENIIVSTELAVVHSFQGEFERLWAKMDPF
ncbi:MAG: hypothetical protein RLZZ519_2189 [Bacteroidota bacterium]|jgi:cardiolipin hydrolase